MASFISGCHSTWCNTPATPNQRIHWQREGDHFISPAAVRKSPSAVSHSLGAVRAFLAVVSQFLAVVSPFLAVVSQSLDAVSSFLGAVSQFPSGVSSFPDAVRDSPSPVGPRPVAVRHFPVHCPSSVSPAPTPCAISSSAFAKAAGLATWTPIDESYAWARFTLQPPRRWCLALA